MTILELKSRRDALSVQRTPGVPRVSHAAKAVNGRSVAESDRAIEAVNREITGGEMQLKRYGINSRPNRSTIAVMLRAHVVLPDGTHGFGKAIMDGVLFEFQNCVIESAEHFKSDSEKAVTA